MCIIAISAAQQHDSPTAEQHNSPTEELPEALTKEQQEILLNVNLSFSPAVFYYALSSTTVIAMPALLCHLHALGLCEGGKEGQTPLIHQHPLPPLSLSSICYHQIYHCYNHVIHLQHLPSPSL